MQRFFKWILFLPFLFLIACSSTQEASLTPESAFQRANELEENERFELALAKYEEIRNKYPYSHLAKEAELRIADIYFKREEFGSAALAYSNFRDLHPNHPKTPYVIYRIGLSYFNKLPEKIGRDVSEAAQAIVYFQRLVDRFPNSEYKADAEKKMQKAYNLLANKVLYIADFYFIREKYLSALLRYEQLIGKKSSPEIKAKGYLGAGLSALKEGELTKAQKYLKTVVANYPNSKEAEKAQGALESNGLL